MFKEGVLFFFKDFQSRSAPENEKQESVSIVELFRFASRRDKIHMIISTILAVLGGTILPMLLLSMKDLHDRMVDLGLEANNPFTCGEENLNQEKGKPLPLRPVFSAGASMLRSINFTGNDTWNQNKSKPNHDNALEGLPIETLMEMAANVSSLQHYIPLQFTHYSLDVLSRVKDKLLNVTTEICLRMSVLAVIQVAIMYAITTLSTLAAAKQGYRIRSAFMTSLLRQEVAWFDAQQDENFAVRLLRSLDCIQEGIGDKVVLSILNMMNSLAVLGTAFSMSWIVTAVILSSAPFICFTTILLGRCHIFYTRKQMQAYSKAGTVAEEALSGIRTVLAYGAEQKEMTRYKRGLTDSKRIVLRQACCLGFGYGLIWFLSFVSFALAIWYGCRKVVMERCQPNATQTSNVLAVILCVMNAAVSISQAAANFEAFSAARAAAVKIFHIIDRVPVIDSTSNKGHKPVNAVGAIEFQNVFFHYPSRTDTPVLQNLSLTISSGETVALVGTSGCGKSTVIQLLQRFYDPGQGEILLDGISLKDLNVGWLRSQIGAVGQEPVLFEMSIGENIALGQPGVTFGALVQASICAGAHDFIMKLPQKYDTLVGEKGTQLSGGQKQRVAIARALVKNPKILLLDEATSALDSVSEAAVKEALEVSKKGRTTLVVAHRLSTIRNADRIVFLKDGCVAEVGTHDELLAKREHYYHLVISQDYGAQVILENKRLSLSSDDDIYNQEGRLTQQRLVFNIGKHLEHQLENGIDQSETTKTKELVPVRIRTFSLCSEDLRVHQSWFLPFQLCSSEWHLLFLGAIASVLVGMSIPLFAVIYTKSITMLQLTKEEAFRDINDKAIQLLVIGITSAVSAFFQTLTFDLAGERMTRRIRRKMFRAMLDQDVSWFDDPKNFSGALCTRLTKDASSVQEASAGLMRSTVQATSSLVTCMYMELSSSLSLTLAAAAFLPVVVLSTQIHKAAFGGVHKRNNHAEERSSQTAVEAIRSIRTVASLHMEFTFVTKFVDYLRKQYSDMKRTCHLNGLMYGLSRGTMPFTCAACIYYGAHLIIDGKLTYEHLFQMIQAIIISMEILTQTLGSCPNYGKSWESSERIIQLLSQGHKRKAFNPKDQKKVKDTVLQGDIEFRNVHFSYPLRQEVKVLKGLDLKVKAGQTLALLGTSGCGKSTCIGLLQGFYNCQLGEVLIDGVNIKDYDLGWLRSQMGVVSQEPVLFGVSLAENISYGSKAYTLNSHQIISAARTANIHSFVRDLPLGYQTRAGGRESWLSGGEKQRIAIARALVRNPKILLLDEATSALDSEAEKVVQEALENARLGRTCVVIAHRLSTVQNADQIVIIHEGAAVEWGTHKELMAKKGFYYEMQRMQHSTNVDV